MERELITPIRNLNLKALTESNVLVSGTLLSILRVCGGIGYSVLGRIIRVTEEVMDYRRWIGKNFTPTYSDRSITALHGSIDSVPPSCAPSDHSSTQELHGKSYANAVTMNSQSKR